MKQSDGRTKKPASTQDTVPFPSSDLIVYRFDQIDDKFEKSDKKTDERFDGLSRKLDKITDNFASKEELASVDDRIKKVEANIGKVAWLVIAAVIVTVLVQIGLKPGG